MHKVDMFVLAEVARDIATVASSGKVDEPGEVDTGELDRLRERLDALAEPYAEGAITLSQFTNATKALRDKIEAAEQALGSGSMNARELSAGEAFELYTSASVEGKRELLKGGFEITIHPVGKGQWIDPTRQVIVAPRKRSRRPPRYLSGPIAYP
ncbi:hypothetical protein ACFQW6_13755 [Nocardioides sp. GCM10028917]|uniref:hypothetical protein n=1 Tax=Nocardioides sp. GCM10028917 TaxID=3273408 RepID=UPI0036098235